MHVAEHPDIALQGGMALQQCGDARVQGAQLRVEGAHEAAQRGGDCPGPRRLQTVAVAVTLLDEIPPRQHEGLQHLAHRIRCLPARQAVMALGAIPRQGCGIDRVGFSQCAERADEGFDLARVGAVRGNLGGKHGRQQLGLVAAGRFADDEAGGVQSAGEAAQ